MGRFFGFFLFCAQCLWKSDVKLSLFNCTNMKRESECDRFSRTPNVPENKFSFSPGITHKPWFLVLEPWGWHLVFALKFPLRTSCLHKQYSYVKCIPDTLHFLSNLIWPCSDSTNPNQLTGEIRYCLPLSPCSKVFPSVYAQSCN